MPLNHTVLKINYKLMFDSLHPLELECMEKQDGIIRCTLTWSAAKSRPGMLDRLADYTRANDKIVWFQAGDPYKGSKPFEITWIGLESLVGEKTRTIVILVVTGQKSERIKNKWIGKLSSFFGYPVSIVWEEDAQ